MQHACVLRSPAGDGRAFCLRAPWRVAVLVLVASSASAQVRDSAGYLARMDANGDGRVQLVEYQDWMSYAFDAMDRDHDGMLQPSELPGGRGAALTRAQHRARVAEVFHRQDRDGDGQLDTRELAAPPR